MLNKFILTIPLQSKENLKKINYKIDTSCNLELTYEKETCFPIIPIIYNNVLKVKEQTVFEIIVLLQKNLKNDGLNPNVINNFSTFKEELEYIKLKRPNISFIFKEILVSSSEVHKEHIKTFKNIIKEFEENILINLCLTFGQKPLAVLLFMAINYALRIGKKIELGNVVYGELIRDDKGHVIDNIIFDISSLFVINDIVINAGNMHSPSIDKILDAFLNSIIE